MGEVNAEITIRNGSDLVLVRKGHLDEQNVRTVTVNALVDTGAATLVISNKLREVLGLDIIGEEIVSIAGGSTAYCDVAEPVQICWKNRTSYVQPWILSEDDEVLIGQIPLEEMDLIIDPKNQTLTGRHGDKPRRRL